MPSQRWDIFCRVIDNFGDIGVSWRLARQLAVEHGLSVRLWVDQLASLRALAPQADAHAARQSLHGVEVCAWEDKNEFPEPGDVVIEAFGCGLPAAYVQALAARAQRNQPSLWIVLEYLSAEPWVREHHGLPSPHPQLNLKRYFFFPGFTQGTGGVLREAALLASRDAFDDAARRAWWSRLGFADVPRGALTVSLFAYPHAPLAQLLDACAQGETAVVMAIPESALAARAREHLRCAAARQTQVGRLDARFIPFVPQPAYDALLWGSDINFVRGEDSFVRAQWAGRPFVWHIYPQSHNAHAAKLDAFLAAYGEVLAPATARAVNDAWRAWNGVADAPPFAAVWPVFCAHLAQQRQALAAWRTRLLGIGDLAGNLLNFCRKMV
ncbi:MAG: elongation factor P maturation arginine rhamnosyltransferase EarP [Betaproteobacteria bacterium]|nr:elongation factor P maturation arginine rhamnosyltransferase EarP [Betaproteobacteria bacterium]